MELSPVFNELFVNDLGLSCLLFVEGCVCVCVGGGGGYVGKE